MGWDEAIINKQFVSLIMIAVLLAVTVTAQQKSEENGWQVYSPSGSSFSIRVPGNPQSTQSSIFDGDNEWAYRLIEHGIRSKTYNFEVHKDSKRWFLVSILEVQITKQRPHRFITDSEVEAINDIIGDGIVYSKVERRSAEHGEISQWSYNRKGGLGDDDDDDGIVYVKRRGTCMVIVLIDYDYAKAGDVEIKAMLDSLRVR